MMSCLLPFDISALIIDIVGENKDTNLLKELALVSHSFHQICIKHLFASVELQNANPNYHIASSKKGFVKLLKSRPDVVNYIRELKYEVCHNNDDDHLLSPILLNFLPTISRLNCLAINGLNSDWNKLDSSLTSAFVHLMRLPTINHIDLSCIANFPLSSIALSVNLLRLDMCYLTRSGYFDHHGEDSVFETVQSKMIPKIRELQISGSYRLMEKFLDAKRQDGRPAFNFMDLRRLSMSYFFFEEERTVRYLLQNAKLLENLHLSIDSGSGRSLVGILSTSARTLKVLDLAVSLYNYRVPLSPLAGLCEELEAMAGHNMLEALSFQVRVGVHHTEDFIGYAIQKVENILVKPGWSALREVSIKLLLARGASSELSEALQSLPDKYLSHLPKLESVQVTFNYSAHPAPVRNRV